MNTKRFTNAPTVEEILDNYNYDIEPNRTHETLVFQQTLAEYLQSQLAALPDYAPPSICALLTKRLLYLQRHAPPGLREDYPDLFLIDPFTFIVPDDDPSPPPSEKAGFAPTAITAPESEPLIPSTPIDTDPSPEPDLSHFLKTQLLKPGDPTDDDLAYQDTLRWVRFETARTRGRALYA